MNEKKGSGILYIAFIREDSEAIGFVKKIKSQCKAFSNLNFRTYLFTTTKRHANLYKIEKNNVVLIKNFEYSKKAKYIENRAKILNKLSTFYRFNEFLTIITKELNHLKIKNIYFRRMKPLTKSIFNFFKICKRNNIKVFYEFPDYPMHVPNHLEIPKYLSHIYDLLAYKQLKKYIDVVVGISVNKQARELNTMLIKNGIDLNTTPLKENNQRSNNINLVCVAKLSHWHAYDRLIEGLSSYYNQNHYVKDVYFHIIGEGTELSKLKQMVAEQKLEKYVIFHGSKTGSDLDEIINECDVGIGALGTHRINMFGNSSLKNREYCARGLPFVLAAYDYDFDSDFKYKLQVPVGDEKINIMEIIEFYEDIRSNDKFYSEKMRDFAKSNLSWEAKLLPVSTHFKV